MSLLDRALAQMLTHAGEADVAYFRNPQVIIANVMREQTPEGRALADLVEAADRLFEGAQYIEDEDGREFCPVCTYQPGDHSNECDLGAVCFALEDLREAVER